MSEARRCELAVGNLAGTMVQTDAVQIAPSRQPEGRRLRNNEWVLASEVQRSMPIVEERSPKTDAIPGPALMVELDPVSTAPRAARVAIASYCDDGGIGAETKATVLLLVSELVTNAVIHSDADLTAKIRLRTDRSRSCLRIEVTDQGSGFKPTPRDPAQLQRGYGLYLLAQEATSWGVQQLEGNTVWFEVALPGN